MNPIEVPFVKTEKQKVNQTGDVPTNATITKPLERSSSREMPDPANRYRSANEIVLSNWSAKRPNADSGSWPQNLSRS